MKPKPKPPGTKRLKLKCDILLSTFAFKFKLRRYNVPLADLPRIAHKLEEWALTKQMAAAAL